MGSEFTTDSTPSEDWHLMLSGEQYNDGDPYLVWGRARSKQLSQKYNNTVGYSTDYDMRKEFLKNWFGAVGDGIRVEPPFRCDYGTNIKVGKNFYANFDCCFLDCAPIVFGDNVFCGPGVQVYTPTHPIDPISRRSTESANPISIGSDVWIGGGAIIVSNRREGLRIGNGCVIGAGSVVTKDIPDFSVAVGNPARVMRKVDRPADYPGELKEE